MVHTKSGQDFSLQEKHHIGAQIDVWGLVLSDVGRAMKEATK